MKIISGQNTVVLAALGLLLPFTAGATNGYFSHGYGTKNKALAGAGVALPQDAMITATNPAGMVYVGDRMDMGLAVFSPQREYTAQGGNGAGTFEFVNENVESDSNYFLIPHFAKNWAIDADRSVGITVYGNGGMNTDYPDSAGGGLGVFKGGAAGGPTGAGVDLSQLFISTTYANKISPSSAFGASLIFGYQRFKATGLKAFGGFSSNSTKLTDNGYDSSTGWGGRIGWMSEFVKDLTLAASYQTKMKMTKFDKYAGLFAEQGDFDIPANWTIGMGYKLNDRHSVVMDIQKIMYSDIPSVSNPFSLIGAGNLGTDQGAGFGWQDMTIYKIGYQWVDSDTMTYRVGISKGRQPIPNSETVFNVLAPAVIEEHLTFGFTRVLNKNNEFNFAMMYAPKHSVSGKNRLSGTPPDQNVTLEMTQYEIEASWGWKF